MPLLWNKPRAIYDNKVMVFMCCKILSIHLFHSMAIYGRFLFVCDYIALFSSSWSTADFLRGTYG